jgi:hypothetical protein
LIVSVLVLVFILLQHPTIPSDGDVSNEVAAKLNAEASVNIHFVFICFLNTLNDIFREVVGQYHVHRHGMLLNHGY